MLKLIPAVGALPTSHIPNFSSPFEYAATDSGAISYPDGHPSEETAPLDPKDFSFEGKSVPTIKAFQDDKLRRFASLGWVVQEDSQGLWKRTGHVLVMDMDDREVRHRQPWFVLASEWPSDGEETAEGDFVIHAEETVSRGDNTVAGVFPGDNNRTPICSIKPMHKSKNDRRVVLKQFGPDFQFEPVRLGGHRPVRPSATEGPALAQVMD